MEPKEALNLLTVVGTVGQVITAALAALIALIAYNTAKSFNRAQAAKFHTEHMYEFNAQVIQIAMYDAELGRSVGRPVLDSSNVIADYTNFIMLNQIQMIWVMRRNGIFTRDEFDAKLANTARFLQR